ncbi:MAG: type II toxin-antitoxin system RelE/ParE family toxin [Candidatus Omnitrophica bacterium]|jgi:mRNA interferase RelE/StbE|nr:type II toxin-antitoxin system RelE/ParE family toxin [Candidatus Omnitrophota bacterium]
MYKIEFSHSASKQLEKIYTIDKKLYSRLITAIEGLKINPLQGKSLKGRLFGAYSLRIGDYRVIYMIQKNKPVIYIIDLGHRKEIYR